MELKKDKTYRGFALITFRDLYNKKCSLQKSSLATEDAIWLGIDDPEPQIMARDTEEGGVGWVPYYIPTEVSLHTRMHLTVEQVEELLPILENFVKTGEVENK